MNSTGGCFSLPRLGLIFLRKEAMPAVTGRHDTTRPSRLGGWTLIEIRDALTKGAFMILQPRFFGDARGEDRPTAIRSGDLEVRLAVTAEEIDAAQALRYRVFYEEMGARATPETRRTRRDRDRFDAYCDHLLVIDRARGEGAAGIIATYRLLRHS